MRARAAASLVEAEHAAACAALHAEHAAALAKKDEAIERLIQLLSDKQAEYKTALAKKDETIERLIQLLSDKQLRDAPAGAPATSGFSFAAPSAVSYPFAKPAAPAAAPSTSPFVQGSHPGVSCDRSGMMPIVGMRYHLRGYDYDLCQAEYDKLSEFEKCQYEAMAPH
jgi:hypothetical protein